jgi:SAM-dependent methyltransferase
LWGFATFFDFVIFFNQAARLFSFNFAVEEDGTTIAHPSVSEPLVQPEQPAATTQSAFLPLSARSASPARTAPMALLGGLVITKAVVTTREELEAIGDDALLAVDTDIVPGKYEGGFKFWEGAADLANFLLSCSSQAQQPTPLSLAVEGAARGGDVVELGCGHGIPSIALSKAFHPRRVVLQDHDPAVLRGVTMHNWAFNASSEAELLGASFLASDWSAMDEVSCGGSFSLAITSETVYSTAASISLARCLERLVRPGGLAVVAGKVYYFGVGGGTEEFKTHIGQCGQWALLHEERIDTGSGNIRAVLVLEKK